MQYIYFGLLPFLLAAWFVYRGWYKKREMHDGTGGANFLYLFIFVGVYIWLFGFVAGLLSGLLVLAIWLIWGNAVRKGERGRALPSTYAEVSQDTHREYEQHVNESLGLAKSSSHKKAKSSSKRK